MESLRTTCADAASKISSTDLQGSMITSMQHVSLPDHSKNSGCELAISHRAFILPWKIDIVRRNFCAISRGRWSRFIPEAAAKRKIGLSKTGSNLETICLLEKVFVDQSWSFQAKPITLKSRDWRSSGRMNVSRSRRICRWFIWRRYLKIRFSWDTTAAFRTWPRLRAQN